MEPAPGMVVTQNLRLEHMLGEGGMGTVWVAHHTGLDTQVAVKFITTEIAKKRPKLVERFRREAGIAAKLRSPHVVQVFDHGLTEDGTPYIAMELLEGEELLDRLKNRGALSLRETALMVSQCSRVLGKAHKLGVVHRDIKPANIFLEESDYEIFCKVLDFGIAKQADVGDMSVTSTGAMLGSPLYMSPEQFTSAKGVDGRSDLWSLAVCAYQCLTLKVPFTGEAVGQVMMAVMTRQYTPIRQLRPDLPEAVDTWFARAFAELDQRFPNSKEFAQAFVEIANSAGDVSAPLAMNAMPSQDGLSVSTANTGERTSALPHGSFPGTEGSFPGTQGSFPGTQGSHPGTQGSHPGTQGSYPGTQGSFPGTGGSHAGGSHPGMASQPGVAGSHPGTASQPGLAGSWSNSQPGVGTLSAVAGPPKSSSKAGLALAAVVVLLIGGIGAGVALTSGGGEADATSAAAPPTETEAAPPAPEPTEDLDDSTADDSAADDSAADDSAADDSAADDSTADDAAAGDDAADNDEDASEDDDADAKAEADGKPAPAPVGRPVPTPRPPTPRPMPIPKPGGGETDYGF